MKQSSTQTLPGFCKQLRFIHLERLFLLLKDRISAFVGSQVAEKRAKSLQARDEFISSNHPSPASTLEEE